MLKHSPERLRCITVKRTLQVSGASRRPTNTQKTLSPSTPEKVQCQIQCKNILRVVPSERQSSGEKKPLVQVQFPVDFFKNFSSNGSSGMYRLVLIALETSWRRQSHAARHHLQWTDMVRKQCQTSLSSFLVHKLNRLARLDLSH